MGIDKNGQSVPEIFKKINNYNGIHNMITRDANSVPWVEIWEFSKLLFDSIDAVIITKIIAFDKICHSAAKFKHPI